VNYRLGVFGCFYHPALHPAQTSADDRSGNYALLDVMAQIMQNPTVVTAPKAQGPLVFDKSRNGDC